MEGHFFTFSGAHPIFMRNVKAGMCVVVMRFTTRFPSLMTNLLAVGTLSSPQAHQERNVNGKLCKIALRVKTLNKEL
jgi:hypothetical protein